MEKTILRYLELLIGMFLLIPPVISIISIIQQLTISRPTGVTLLMKCFEIDNYLWAGSYESGGYTSALPFYFGLLAITGAYLISHSIAMGKNETKK